MAMKKSDKVIVAFASVIGVIYAYVVIVYQIIGGLK